MSDMPLVVAPESLGARADPRLEPLVEWLAAHRPWFDAQLASHGAIALRGFEIGTMADFQRVVAAFGQPVGRYLGGVSSRTDLGGDVQTSTNYPGHEPVRLHNEFAHAPRRPERILLFALAPSEVDGETTVADGRRIAAALDPELRARFAASGLGYFWTYLARPDSGLARLFKSWQEAFATDDPQEAEAVCRSLGFTSGWTSSGLLWTHSHGPALVSDPIDGAPIWFGQYLARSAGTLAEHAAVTAALAAGPGRGGLMRYVSLGTERHDTRRIRAHTSGQQRLRGRLALATRRRARRRQPPLPARPQTLSRRAQHPREPHRRHPLSAIRHRMERLTRLAAGTRPASCRSSA